MASFIWGLRQTWSATMKVIGKKQLQSQKTQFLLADSSDQVCGILVACPSQPRHPPPSPPIILFIVSREAHTLYQCNLVYTEW